MRLRDIDENNVYKTRKTVNMMRRNRKNLKLKVKGISVDSIEHLHIIRDDHAGTDTDMLLRLDANALDEESKIELIERYFAEIMSILGLDLTDDSLSRTPARVAKMFVKEIETRNGFLTSLNSHSKKFFE